MGKFIIEKMWKIIVLLILLIVVNACAIYGTYYMQEDLTLTDTNSIINTILSNDEIYLDFVDNSLTGTSQEYVFASEDSYVIYGFLTDASKNEGNNIYFIYGQNNLNIYIGKTLINSYEYQEYNISNFSINTDITNIDRLNFREFIELPFVVLGTIVSISNTVVDTISLIIWALLTMLIAFLLSYNINPDIRGKYRFSLLLHSLVPYFMFNLLSVLFSFSLLTYVGVFLSVLYFFIALRSIIKVEKVE